MASRRRQDKQLYTTADEVQTQSLFFFNIAPRAC